MPFDLRTADLDRLNSLTKYPSTPTFHALDPSNGNLLEEPADLGSGPLLLTEKIDGTNARVVCVPSGEGSDWLIGSRNDFLLARGDLIGNPALGIAEALRGVAPRLCAARGGTVEEPTEEALLVFYGEVYGGKVGQASMEYTGAERIGFRLFDVACLRDFEEVLERPRSEISEWREAGGPSYVGEQSLQQVASEAEVELTPRLGEVEALPQHVEEAAAFLEEAISETHSALDDEAGGRPEGLVVRAARRSSSGGPRTAKLRFTDYRRTLRRRKA